MGAEVVAAIIAAVASLAATATSVGVGAAGTEENYRQMGLSRKMQMGMQLVQMYRENTAVQRRVADLKKAGLSPVLAAGQPAMTGSPIRLDTPQYDTTPITQPLMQLPSLINSLNQTMLTQKKIDKIESETEKIDQQRELELANNPDKMNLIKSQAWLNNQKTALEKLKTMQETLDYMAKSGTGVWEKDATYFGKTYMEMAGIYSNLKSQYEKKYGNLPSDFRGKGSSSKYETPESLRWRGKGYSDKQGW